MLRSIMKWTPNNTRHGTRTTGSHTRSRLTFAALVPALIVSASTTQSVGALETTHAVVFDNHFTTSTVGPVHDYGVHNLLIRSASGARFQPRTVGQLTYNLWAGGGNIPPLPQPTIRQGQTVTLTAQLPEGTQLLSQNDLNTHPEWALSPTSCTDINSVLLIKTCTIETSGNDAPLIRINYTLVAQPSLTNLRAYWRTVGFTTLPFTATSNLAPGNHSANISLQFPNPEQSSTPSLATGSFESLPVSASPQTPRTFGVYGNAGSPYIEPNHPGAGNYWPKGGQGKIAFDLQPPTGAPQPMTAATGDSLTFTFNSVLAAPSAYQDGYVYYDPKTETGFPVNDACTVAPAGWEVEFCGAVLGRALAVTWVRTGPPIDDAFAQGYRLELPISRKPNDSPASSNPRIILDASLRDDATSDNVQLSGKVVSIPVTSAAITPPSADELDSDAPSDPEPGAEFDDGETSPEPNVDPTPTPTPTQPQPQPQPPRPRPDDDGSQYCGIR